MKPITTIVCIAAMAWLTSSNAYACSCKLASAEGNAQQATIIFKGFVAEGPSNELKDRSDYQFTPTKIYKGDQQKNLTIHSIRDTCEQGFSKNTEYIVFAYEYKGAISKYKGKLLTDICSSWPVLKEYSLHTKEVEEYFNQRK
jgi:hypothetical protein